MGIKLYELTEKHQQLLEIIEDAEQLDEETLKVLDETKESLDISIEEVVKGLLNARANRKAEVDAYKAEEKRLKEERGYIEKDVERMESYLENQLRALDYDSQNKKRLKAGTFQTGIKKMPASVEVVDEEKVPIQFMKPPKTEWKKAELKKFVQEKLGEDANKFGEHALEKYGVKLVNNREGLHIK